MSNWIYHRKWKYYICCLINVILKWKVKIHDAMIPNRLTESLIPRHLTPYSHANLLKNCFEKIYLGTSHIWIRIRITTPNLNLFTELLHRMWYRKWRETKQEPGTAGPGNMLGSCLVSLHFLWAILSTSTVVLFSIVTLGSSPFSFISSAYPAANLLCESGDCMHISRFCLPCDGLWLCSFSRKKACIIQFELRFDIYFFTCLFIHESIYSCGRIYDLNMVKHPQAMTSVGGLKQPLRSALLPLH